LKNYRAALACARNFLRQNQSKRQINTGQNYPLLSNGLSLIRKYSAILLQPAMMYQKDPEALPVLFRKPFVRFFNIKSNTRTHVQL